MDLIGDTCLAIDHFLRFGLEGTSRYDEVGEKYLRLYGVLNSTYIQQEAVYSLLKLCQVPDQSAFRERIESLNIRESRHKLGAHSIDYIDKHSYEVLSFVPVRFDLGGFHCKYINNTDGEFGNIKLKGELESHLELMIDMMRVTISKACRSLYKSNPDRIEKVDLALEKLSIEKDGGFVHDNEDGSRTAFSPISKCNL